MIVCYCGGFHRIFERQLHVRRHKGAAPSPSVKARSWDCCSWVILEYESDDAQVRRARVLEELTIQG